MAKYLVHLKWPSYTNLKLFSEGLRGNINSLVNISKHLLKHKDLLIDVLTTTPNSKPKARSTHGGTKNRKKTVVTDAAVNALLSNTNAPTSVQGVRV